MAAVQCFVEEWNHTAVDRLISAMIAEASQTPALNATMIADLPLCGKTTGIVKFETQKKAHSGNGCGKIKQDEDKGSAPDAPGREICLPSQKSHMGRIAGMVSRAPPGDYFGLWWTCRIPANQYRKSDKEDLLEAWSGRKGHSTRLYLPSLEAPTVYYGNIQPKSFSAPFLEMVARRQRTFCIWLCAQPINPDNPFWLAKNWYKPNAASAFYERVDAILATEFVLDEEVCVVCD